MNERAPTDSQTRATQLPGSTSELHDSSEVAASQLSLESVTKDFGQHRAVDQITFEVQPSEYVTLLGPSGCGKTTTLSLIGGYITPTGGRIYLDGVDITHTRPQSRNIGFVFQNYALFPHMTVRQNISFGLQVRKWSRSDVAKRVDEMLELVELTRFAEYKPDALSGGMQQRVALGRALAIKPAVLLLDEPFAALDVQLRGEMQREVRRIQQELGVATVHVTHDQDEAMSMADRLIVMNNAKILQEGSPASVYNQPETRFVGEFLGRMNVIKVSPQSQEREPPVRQIALGPWIVDLGALMPEHELSRVSESISIGLRPEHVRIRRTSDIKDDDYASQGGDWVRARVSSVVFLGSREFIVLVVDGLEGQLLAETVGGILSLSTGDDVECAIDRSRLTILN
jgi:ABC-type Fe3+/spermidine/putrescine transport system ATPase subunit